MDPIYRIILSTLTSFLICFFSMPSIVKVAKLKKLYDEPDERKGHASSVPTLGGIAIFAGFLFSVTFWSSQNQIVELQYIIASLIILFFMGIKDDLVNLVAYKKLIAQILAALILIFFADIKLNSLFGLFGIYEIPSWASILFSLTAIIGLTNSINLIDGIDTLAGSVGVLVTSILGTWFFLTGHYQYAILSFATMGSLLAFLWFNKTPASIFMGDTGSLVLGLICSILIIQFIEFNRSYNGPTQFHIRSVPAVAISILIIPIFDTLRVFTIRILKGRSPLSADRNHIHHILIDLGFSHVKATGVLISFNAMLIIINYYFQNIAGELLLLFNLIISLIFTRSLSIFRIRIKSNSNNSLAPK